MAADASAVVGTGTPSGAPSVLPVVGALPGRPDVRYVFTSVSQGSMSDAVGEGDAAANRRAAAAGAGLPPRLQGMRQVHSADVLAVSEAGESLACDGLITDESELTLVVLAADCVPVLMASGPRIAAVHAGRAGVVAGVVSSAARQLTSGAADVATDAQAIIGPAIGPCCYEVPADMAAAVDRALPGARATTTWGTPSLDLPGAVRTQLLAEGITQVHRVGGCTLCSGSPWFSHRGTTSGTVSAGRHAGMIARIPS